MLHHGENWVDGIPVDVERKRIRRINLRVKSDGRVHLSIPNYWATLADGEAFLNEKWAWVLRTRTEILSRPSLVAQPVVGFDRLLLEADIQQLCRDWAARLGEPNVTWRIRAMKSQWGSCHWRKRLLTFNAELAHAPRDLIEYVVVHELTHLQAHDHGPNFYALMTARLPDWKLRRKRLNHRDF